MSSNNIQVVGGLGNPGKEYELTRHNAGFIALDKILADLPTISCVSKFDAKICEVHLPSDTGLQKIFFLYPQTYMNDSGKAIREFLNFYKLGPENLLILHDEVDIPLGTIKFTENSGSAGHNGIKSIIEELGTQDFRRIRIGVESRANKAEIPTDAFVLQKFSPSELEQVPWDAIKARVMLELKPKYKNQ